MRIVHLTASSFFGGPERQMLGLAAALPGRYNSTFLSFGEHGRCRSFLGNVRSAGFDAAELTHDSPYLRSSVREITAFLRENSADVLITHGYKSNVLGRPAARRAGISIVSVSRGWTGETSRVRFYDWIDRCHLRFMDRVVCVSHAQAAKALHCGVASDNIRVIHNAARPGASKRSQPAKNSILHEMASEGEPIVFAAGRLSPEKGFAVLVDAAKHLRARFSRAQFVLFGEGQERLRLLERIERSGLVGTFHLLGFRDNLDALIPCANVVVLPSFTEGLPNVALEAGAASVPVVATAVGGTPEVVAHGQTGFLVPPGDSIALAGRIADLLSNTALAREFGMAAQRRMRDLFSFEGQARAYQELLEEVVMERRQFGARRVVECT